MSFVEQLEQEKSQPAKPIILSDVGGTLLTMDGINIDLIDRLNRAYDEGYDIRIVSAGVNKPGWGSDVNELRFGGLNPALIETAIHKDTITPETFTNVVAMMDDYTEPYQNTVRQHNPGAKHFLPNQLEALNAHLGRIKSQESARGA